MFPYFYWHINSYTAVETREVLSVLLCRLNRNAAVSVLPCRGDWSPQELHEIDRVRALCDQRSGLELECSHTDEGDPWCIVYDQTRGRIILHVAKIDRCYVVVTPPRKSVRATTMSQAVEIALKDLERVIA